VRRTVVSFVEVIPTSLEDALKPHSKIKTKVLAKQIKACAKDCGMSARNRLIRSNKEGSISPLLKKFMMVPVIPSLFPTHLAL